MEIAQEQRIFERLTARFPVKFKHSRQEFGTNVFLRDVAGQGLKITTKEQMFLRDSVSLLIELPDGFEPLALSGRIVWTKEKAPGLWEMGVEFYETHLMKMQRMFRLVI